MNDILHRAALVLLSFSGGLAVGIAAAAILVALSVGARLARWTGTEAHIGAYNWAYFLGILAFTVVDLLDVRLSLSLPAAACIVLLMGAFIAMQACALAEVLDALPHSLNHIPQWGLRAAFLALALGKAGFAALDLIFK